MGIVALLWVLLGCGTAASESDVVSTDTADTHVETSPEDGSPVDVPPTGDTAEASDVAVPPGEGALALCTGDEPKGASFITEVERTWIATCENVTLRLTPMTADTVRFRYVGSVPDAAPDRSYAVIAALDPSVETRSVLIEGGVRLCTQSMAIDVWETACRVRVQDAEGHVLLDDGDVGGYFEGLGVVEGTDGWGVGVRRTIVDNEHFFGFGERNGGLDKRGSILWFWNSDVPGYSPSTDPLYQSIPFFVGLRGTTAYGLLTDNSYRMRMDMGASDPGWSVIEAPGGEMDQYLLVGPSIASVVERYTTLTGRMSMPPRWTLGYHQSRHGYFPDTQVIDIATGLRDRNFPVDSIWLDIDYMDEFRIFTWGADFSADPAGMIAELRADGIRTVVIIDPGVKVDDQWPIYTEGLANGYYVMTPEGTPFEGTVWPGAAVYPDFTHPGARSWWADLVPKVTDMGVEGIWIDMNEPANFDAATSWTVPDWVTAHGEGTPMTMAEAHNLYGSTMAWATYDGLEKHVPQRRPFVLTRAGYAGVQRYAAVWTGDIPSTWEALASTMPMLLNMGLSGLSFVGSDVGGWMGGATPELFARWMQVGSISPFFRNHTQKNTESHEPWAFGVEVEDISRETIQARYRLLPYWYTLLEESTRTGAPLLRPMVYHFQDDGAAHALGEQAMLGEWLLVAPVLEADATEQVVYLPAGRWYEFGSSAVYEGPGLATVTVRQAALPTFVRAGAIIPRQQELEWTDETPIGPLYLDIYPADEPTTFVLYEDDGDSRAYADGVDCRRTYILEPTPVGAQLVMTAREGAYQPAVRNTLIRLHRADYGVDAVYLNGELLPEKIPDSTPPIQQSGPAWMYDERDLSILVNMPDGDAEATLTFEYTQGLTANAPDVLMQFRVEVPVDTDPGEPIHIALSSNGWEHVALAWSADELNVATGLVAVPRGVWFDYKYTRGDWSTVEKYADCTEAKNRYVFGAAHPVKRDRVEAWVDHCP